ncbi:hypothetical protein H0H92_012057 [Tricholoma furcatifolium]|nr:hypothetical protein H0H92_012057 [Tricholoma furcatifolium]
MANIVYDDASSIVSAGGSTWKTVTEPRFFDGSTIYPPNSCGDSGDTGEYATLTVSFQGTSLAMIGNTPASECTQWMEVSIDGGATNQVSYGDPDPQNTMQWYKSPTLSDGSHTISFSRIAGTALDFMVVSAGLTTPLSGLTLIVDDGDSGVDYSGTWSNPSERYVESTSSVEFYPYGNAVHQTSTVGSSMSFQFSGTSISVYSVFDYASIGNMDVDFTVDGTTHSQSFTVSTTTPGYKEGIGHRGNILLFTSTGLSAGTHTLKVELTSNSGMTLALDYFLYTPSFDTLAALEGVNTATITTSSPSTSTAAASSSTDASSSLSSLPAGQSSSSSTGTNASSQTASQTSLGKSSSKSSVSGTSPSSAGSTDGTSSSSSGTGNSSDTAVLRSQSQDLLVKPFLSTMPTSGYPEDVKSPSGLHSFPTNSTPLSMSPPSVLAEMNSAEAELDNEQDLTSPTLSYTTSRAFHGTSLVDVDPAPAAPGKADLAETSSLAYLVPPLTAVAASPALPSSQYTNDVPNTPAYLGIVTPLNSSSPLPLRKGSSQAYLIPPLTAQTTPLTPLRKQDVPDTPAYLIPPLTAVDITSAPASPLSPFSPPLSQKRKGDSGDSPAYLIPPLAATPSTSRALPIPRPNPVPHSMPPHQGPSTSTGQGSGQQERSSTAILRNRMQRLQDLVEELNFALAEGKASGAHVAELRRRIKELSQDDAEAIELDWRAPAGVPPPYRR